MGYIKSKSNYVIKSKHQVTNDGTIYERDAVTIGGLTQFGSTNQVPVYNSGNFVLTINNEDNTSKNISNNKWEENENGEVWTLNDVKNVKDENSEIDANIVLKHDYYSLKDFAYFGSCSELIRVSINGILESFPGEMYGATITSKGRESGLVVYYTDNTSGISIDKSVIKQLGGDNAFVLENPFGIDMHTIGIEESKVKDKLKYFCNNGFKNYALYNKDNTLISDITSWVYVEETDNSDCRKIGKITLNGTYNIYLYKGDGNMFYYLYKNDTLKGIHIRPKSEFYDTFIKTLDSFQQILMNPNTSPKYKAIFEIISENDYGYLTTVKSFVMPLGNGGYNIGANGIPFEMYLKELSDIASFYDEKFCDNLYRSMTHESIKNFDWTYNRESVDEETDEYEIGGNKIANLIRIYGRQFDNIKAYIDNIGNSNTISYNDINNVPDYFLTDELENDGWDVNNVFSLDLNEYITIKENDKDIKKFRDKTTNGITFINTFSGKPYGVINEKENKVGVDYTLKRLFKQNISMKVKPYSIDNINDYKYGYFNTCCTPFKKEHQLGDSNIYIDNCASTPILRTLIQLYSSEREYVSEDINNAFMKRLKLNSRQLFRNKGTVSGIEMILSMFGMKSKKWWSLLPIDKQKSFKYDYEIIEYTSFTNPIEDVYDNDKKMFKIDWYNSTKLIQYNTKEYMNNLYIPYQGLPVAYRDVKTDSKKRKLYPYFDKNDYYDGNPYYQMNGGWLRKEQISFDKDNNVLYNNDKAYTETLRTIKSVNNLKELTTIPMQVLLDGDIYYVNNINESLAIVDGQPYDIKTEEVGGVVYRYFSVFSNNGTLSVGDVYFYEFVNVSYPFNDEKELKIILSGLENNSEIKIYIIDNNIKAEANGVTINNFMIFENGQYSIFPKNSNFTHYFRINNVDYKSEISPYGWEQLSNTDNDYYRLNSIINYYKGNNPHNGNLIYDNGYEYLTYFKQIFKYPYNDELFDKRCYGDSYYEEMNKISTIGFRGLVNDDDVCDLVYPLYEDSKIHYMGNLYTNSKITTNNIFAYQNVNGSIGDNVFTDNIVTYFYTNEKDNDISKSKYNLKNVCRIHNNTTKTLSNDKFYGDINSDGVTNEIVNNKRIDIIFNVSLGELDKDTLEHVKYIDSVVTPYMTQFIPPTAICTIKYI